ncbi:S-layer homology domain-containing protein [Paenibacillus aestuarii]|uniref:S-layer homology domain-containing protein n=1 Tax=Paenibacillus aestuarii TaxID=516965 RepID=A0ABW0KAT9_9BACL|nr:S-layer homology domain-containing protein [Paenibacillus aestuarii]
MKLLKQVGSIAVASSLLLAAVPHAWADEAAQSGAAVSDSVIARPVMPVMPGQVDGKLPEASLSKERALELAQSYVTIPSGYTLQSISLNGYYGGGRSYPTWNISYAKKVKDQFYGNINISINGIDGSLSSYYKYDQDPDRKPSYPPKVDFKGAKDAASAWITKVNPSKQSDLLYNDTEEKAFRTPLDGNYQYNIRFDRSVAGVPFPQNGVNVTVNGDGEVVSYNYNWDDQVTFDQSAAAITIDKAAQLFKDKAKLSLQYQIPYRADAAQKKQPIISYTFNGFSLNAVTGELWNPVGGDSAAAGRKPLTDKPLGSKPAANLNLTKEQAVRKVIDTFGLSSDLQLQDASYNESTNPETGETESTWNLNWNKPADKEANSKIVGGGAWATVDSKTGEIKNFNSYASYEPDKEVDAKVSLDTAAATATDFVKKLLPAYTDQLVLDVPNEKDFSADQLKHMRNWEVSFKRVIDGVAAGYEQASLSVDRTTGKIVNFSISFSDVPYPTQKPEVIDIDKAKDLLLSQYDIKLNYVLAGNRGVGVMPLEKYNLMVASGEILPQAADQSADDKLTAKLVYSLVPKYTQEAFLLDAQSGQWKSANTGEVITLGKIKVDDIDNHWARNELQLMVDYQALDVKDGKVNPEQTMTRGEMIKMLVIAINGGNSGFYYGAERKASFADVKAGSPYFAYVESAVDRGLLDPGADFNPNAPMNREDMAQLIVKALGYQNLTKYEGIFNTNFADAAQLKNAGAAVIVLGLGIMSLDNNSFEPQQEVSRAQAASAFFRFLQKRAELQSTPHIVYR